MKSKPNHSQDGTQVLTTLGVVNLPLDKEGCAWITKHWMSVCLFIKSGSPIILEEFEGVGLTDGNGHNYMLETRPHVILRRAANREFIFPDFEAVLSNPDNNDLPLAG